MQLECREGQNARDGVFFKKELIFKKFFSNKNMIFKLKKIQIFF